MQKEQQNKKITFAPAISTSYLFYVISGVTLTLSALVNGGALQQVTNYELNDYVIMIVIILHKIRNIIIYFSGWPQSRNGSRICFLNELKGEWEI